jgi:hypothetical protein
MSLIGKGVLAIWNGIAAGAEQEFVAWHVHEHMPERIGLPGFLRGRRYAARHGYPAYFNFYEADTTEAFSSLAYRTRLDNPTPWTRQVVAHFTDTSRTVCDVIVSLGCGEGAFIESRQIRGDRKDLGEKLIQIAEKLAAERGVVGAHVLRGRQPNGAATAEMALRKGPDQTADWILLVEAVSPEVLATLQDTLLSQDGVAGASGPGCGVYELQFALTKQELQLGARKDT